MKEYESIESLERVSALLHPLRVRIMAAAAGDAVSAVELGKELGETPQKLNYHLKALERAGLLKKVREEKRRNLTKAYYQAQARRLWLSPKLMAETAEDARAARDQLSLHHLVGLAREVERDVIALLNRSRRAKEAAASLGIRAELAFPSGEARRGFMDEYVQAIERLVSKYGAKDASPAPERYTAVVAVYPARGRSRAPKKDGGRHVEGAGEEG